jgi:MFS family permease
MAQSSSSTLSAIFKNRVTLSMKKRMSKVRHIKEITLYFGPKSVMIANGIFAVVVNFGLAATRLIGSYWWLVGFRFLSGMNSGVNSIVAPVFLNDIAPRNLKGVFGTAFQVMLCLGLIFSEVLGLVWLFGTNQLWPYCFLMGVLPAGLQIVLGLYRRFDYKTVCLG